ncbi:MAG TPA: porin [Steroidobacteraceae bacterium]|nr:porin [Steroidobacteraceae bacterium]
MRPSLRQGTCAAVISTLAILFSAIPRAQAQDMGADRFTFRGFGSVGATTHDTDGIEYRRNTGQGSGARSGEVDFATDSLLGLQVDARLSSKLDVVVQGVTRQRADDSWRPRFSQAYLRFSPGDSLVLRAGRIGYDIYLLAESRQVGYSYLPVRPSPEFYGQITNDDIDGLDVAWTRRIGRGLVKARVFGGDGSGELAFADRSTSDTIGQVYGGTFDYIFRGWTARVALVQFNYDAGADIPLLAGALRATGFPSAAAVAEDLDHRSYRSDGVQVGVAYDDGPMLAQVMYGAVDSDSIAGPDFDKLYALCGYRLGKWTPFASFASSNDRSEIHDAGLPPIPQLAPLNGAVVQIQQATRSTQHTGSLGLRYDLNPHIDFKFQVDRTHVRDSSLLFDYRPDAGTPFDMTVITAAVDFVF